MSISFALTVPFILMGFQIDETAPTERVLTFPEGASLGLLKTCKRPSGSPCARLWRPLVPASGEVRVSRGRLIQLIVDRHHHPRLTWLDGLRPDDLYLLTLAGTSVTDDDLVHLKGLTGLRQLDLSNTEISGPGLNSVSHLGELKRLILEDTSVDDQQLARLKGLNRLTELNLTNTRITDAGLQYLTQFTSLRTLKLRNTRISDAGLKHLLELPSLEVLNLTQTNITDEGVQRLATLSSLKTLDVWETNVSPAGIERLSKALPGCRVWCGPVNQAVELHFGWKKSLQQLVVLVVFLALLLLANAVPGRKLNRR